MKKILCILVLLFTSLIYAQLPIQTPPSYETCDINNDGTELFYLPFMNSQILGSLNPNDYSFEYYADVNSTITITSPYLTASTTIYVKVIENTNQNNFAITSLNLVLKPSPIINIITNQATCSSNSSITFMDLPTTGFTSIFQTTSSSGIVTNGSSTYTISNILPGTYSYYVSSSGCTSPSASVTIIQQSDIPVVNQQTELHQSENSFDGIGVFNLTSQEVAVIGTQIGLDLVYYTTEADAQNGTNQIVTQTTYQNISNPQTIWVRVTNTVSGCYQTASFKIKMFDATTIVNIPDANFKARLLAANGLNQIAFTYWGGIGSYKAIDINGDGEIQYTEAANVLELNVNSQTNNQKISDLTGIEAFTQVSNLNCSNNLLTALNITPLVNNSLWNLNCSYNNLSNFDYNSLGNISYLDCSSNQLSALSIDNLINLTRLSCSNNQLTNLNIQPFHLTYLDCSNNQIATLNFGYPQEMTSLKISNNLITNLDLSLFSLNLQYLFCDGNTIDTLDFSNTDLWQLNCGPVLNPINVENQSNLRYFIFRETEQENLNLFNNLFLNTISFHNVNVTSLDFSNCSYITNLNILDSQNLEYLNLKTGKTWYGNVGNFYSYPIQISGCPNLNFVCSDEQNINKINQALSYHTNNSAVFVSSYCTFTPGGNYNTINGLVQFDADNNGCDANDDSQNNVRVNINDGTDQGATFTNVNGDYTFYTQAGNFDITPAIENPSFFSVSPTTATIPFADNNNNTATQNFCITANGVHPDLEIVIVPITPARPGFDAVYKLVYRNKGNQTLSGNIIYTFNDAILDYVTSSIIPTTLSYSEITWNYSNLKPFESRGIVVTLNVNSPMETPAVNIGDVLINNVLINPVNNDENVSDNAFGLNQTVVGSYDPNDITCLEGDIVSPTEIGKYLHYNIRFENTGTAAAENVVVKVDVNPADFDINSLQLMNTSNPVDARINGNKVEFIFQNIMLESGGHGNVLLKMRTKANLQQGDLVNKRANIYFDYNFPIETNDAETLFQALSNPSFEQDSSISIYPNPASSIINIKSNFNIKTIELYDVQGRLLQTDLVNTSETSIDITSKSKGMYFIKITSEKGIKVEKLIIE